MRMGVTRQVEDYFSESAALGFAEGEMALLFKFAPGSKVLGRAATGGLSKVSAGAAKVGMSRTASFMMVCGMVW